MVHHSKTKIILGPPGTGKTHNLLNLVEQELAKGTSPDRIAFVAFTKKAATEARDRAMKKFKLEEQHLPYFRTLHSFAFHQLGLTKSEVMSRDNYKEFAKTFGMDLGSVTDGAEAGGVVTTDNILINEINLARMKCMDLEHHYNTSNLQDMSWHSLLRAQRSLEEFKKKKEVFDFTDMIELYLDSGPVPKLEVVFVDEAQDLCKLQWRMINKLTENARKVYVSGDDDQAIYNWAGADVRYFIKLPGEVETLKQSFRCSKVIQNLSGRIINRVKFRRVKQWKGTDRNGFVQYHNYPEGVDLRGDGSWLVMARTNYMLDEIERDIRLQGMLYKRNNKLPEVPTFDKYKEYLPKIIERLSVSSKVAICTLPPIGENKESKVNQHVNQFNDFIKIVAKEKNIHLLQVSDALWSDIDSRTYPSEIDYNPKSIPLLRRIFGGIFHHYLFKKSWNDFL